jgi:hypothetical protein
LVGDAAGLKVIDTRVSTSAAAAGDTSTSFCSTRRADAGPCGTIRPVT